MPLRSLRRWSPRAALLLALATAPARADLIFLRDGTVLQGKLIQEMRVEVDPYEHEPIRLGTAFFLIDDGPRRMYFAHSQVGENGVVKQQVGTSEVQVKWERTAYVPSHPVPPIYQVERVDPWDAKWNRRIYIRSKENTHVDVPQHLMALTPHYAKASATGKYVWANYYLTRELGPDVVDQLLATNPECVDDPKLAEGPRLARRFKVCDFYAQAGWYDRAERALDKVAADFPGKTAQVEAARDALHKARAREQFDLIKRLHLAGRYQAARELLEAFPEKEAAETTAVECRAYKSSFDEAAAKYADTVRLLDGVAADLRDAPEGLAEALTSVRTEIHPDRAGRLEPFLGQALQAERQRKAGRTPETGPGSLAALAVSGWLLGAPSSDAKPETALRLWRSRKLVLDYLRKDSAAERDKLLKAYAGHKDEYAALDEISQMIPQLPPEAPEPDTRGAAVELRAGDERRGALYVVKVPPEYSHNRAYPVLLALPPEGVPAQQMLGECEAVCAENGYILAVPRWQQGANPYAFSEREHQVVLDVLRDLRRRFQVDSDRVFLLGAGWGGGEMAFDVGLSHPDLFAAVLPIAAGPSYFSEVYWRSAKYLPFYVVGGDRSGDGNKKVREIFNNWVPRGFNSLWVQYKGRGVEWFGAELPWAFDWMRNKRRSFPMQQLGSDGLGGSMGNEFYTMRECDNRFYWLSTDEVASGCCNSFERWNNRVNPAKLTGRIDAASNEVYVKATGVRQVTVWLGRNAKGEGMVDFERPLTVRVNLAPRWNNRKVTPSLEVLLKDLLERGDRQRLFVARLDFKL